jgi:hypothetical protein
MRSKPGAEKASQGTKAEQLLFYCMTDARLVAGCPGTLSGDRTKLQLDDVIGSCCVERKTALDEDKP